MDDLISREAAIETVKKLLYETAFNSCGHHQDDEIYADIAEHRIEVWLGLVPSVPAVPLDKLCEWLNKNQGELPPCPFDDDCYECGLDGVECIKKRIKAWMEGQDAAD